MPLVLLFTVVFPVLCRIVGPLYDSESKRNVGHKSYFKVKTWGDFREGAWGSLELARPETSKLQKWVIPPTWKFVLYQNQPQGSEKPSSHQALIASLRIIPDVKRNPCILVIEALLTSSCWVNGNLIFLISFMHAWQDHRTPRIYADAQHAWAVRGGKTNKKYIVALGWMFERSSEHSSSHARLFALILWRA